MRYKEYGETLQMGREKYGKMLRKAMIKCEKRDKMIVKSAEKRYRSRIFLDAARAVLTLILRKYALYLHLYQLYFYLQFRQWLQ